MNHFNTKKYMPSLQKNDNVEYSIKCSCGPYLVLKGHFGLLFQSAQWGPDGDAVGEGIGAGRYCTSGNWR